MDKKTKDPLIEAEEVVSEITGELKKLKKVSKQLENADTKSESLIKMSENLVEKTDNLIAKGSEIIEKMEDVDFPSKFDKLNKEIETNKQEIIEKQEASSKRIKAVETNFEQISSELKKGMVNFEGEVISKIDNFEAMFLDKQKRDHTLYIVIIILLIITLTSNLLL